MYDRKQWREDRNEEQEQEAYEEAFYRIEKRLIKEWECEFGSPYCLDEMIFKPSSAEVHRLVEIELKQRREE